MPTVKVKLDNIRAGVMVEIPYLGYFPNDGETHDVEQTTWNRFVTHSPLGQSLEEGADHCEVTTEAQKKATEAHSALREANMDSLEKDYDKDELQDLASASNIDTKGKTKAELATEIKKSQSTKPDGFSSVAEATDESQEE